MILLSHFQNLLLRVYTKNQQNRSHLLPINLQEFSYPFAIYQLLGQHLSRSRSQYNLKVQKLLPLYKKTDIQKLTYPKPQCKLYVNIDFFFQVTFFAINDALPTKVKNRQVEHPSSLQHLILLNLKYHRKSIRLR